MDSVFYAYATIILAPLCIALIVLYLQQIEKVGAASQDRKTALDDLAKAKDAIAAQSQLHAVEIKSLKLEHEVEIERKNKEIAVLDTKLKAVDFLKSRPDILSQYAQQIYNSQYVEKLTENKNE